MEEGNNSAPSLNSHSSTYHVIDQPITEDSYLLFHDVIVDEGGYDGDRDDVAALLDEATDLLVLHSNHVLAVHLNSTPLEL